MKFNKPVAEAILKELEEEVPYELACESNGISYHTFKLWLSNGQRDLIDGKRTYYSQFLEAVRKVQTNRVKLHLSNARSAEKGHRGSEWVLERAYW
jgi:hypothetical protein